VVGKFGRHDTAYVHRDMLTLLLATPVWAIDAPHSVETACSRGGSDDPADRSPHPRRELSELPNCRISDWRREYYAENFSRLVKVERKYDPHHLTCPALPGTGGGQVEPTPPSACEGDGLG
jgi:Berberine and berberine like